jgi:hypothetical protein
MEILVCDNNTNMNMHEKTEYLQAYIFVKNILVSEFLKFCTMNYCITINLVQPTA